MHNPRLAAAAARRQDLGVLAQPASGVHLAAGQYRLWAADNGCFSRGDDFDPGRYLAWLTRLPHRHRLLFAVAPDVCPDHAATWARSELVLPRIRGLGIPAAFVAQNGMEDDPNIRWDRFDALFVGVLLGALVSRMICRAGRRVSSYVIHGLAERAVDEWYVGVRGPRGEWCA